MGQLQSRRANHFTTTGLLCQGQCGGWVVTAKQFLSVMLGPACNLNDSNQVNQKLVISITLIASL